MNFRYHLGFTKNQYKGLALLLAINLAVIFYYFIDNYLYQSKPAHDFSELILHLDSLESYQSVSIEDSLYAFDPNFIGAIEFEKLGLNRSLADRITRYISKGGRFQHPTDLLKIYGMYSSWYKKVELFIDIETKTISTVKEKKVIHPFSFNPNTISYQELLKMGLNESIAKSWIKYIGKGGSFKTCIELEKLYLLDHYDLELLLPFCEIELNEVEMAENIDINESDSLKLMKVRGIGPTYAHRILDYRKLLGGYVSLEQLNEIFGIDSLKYSQLVPHLSINDRSVLQLNINTDEFKVLLKHPYLSYEQVKSILNYRNELGVLNDFSELQQLEGFGTIDTSRLKPYVSFKIN